MPINTISQTISTIPEAGHRGIDVQTQFVIKQEDFQDHLQGTTVAELNALKTQINTTVTGMNTAVENVNTKTSEASASTSSASASANTATTKAEEASASASSASASATKAGQWANANYNVQVETGKYSAKHWSTVAQNTVTNKVDKVTSTDNAIVRFNGTTGDVQNSNVIIDDNNNVGVGVIPSGNYKVEAPNNYTGSFKFGYLCGGTSGSSYSSVGYNFRTTVTNSTYLYDRNDTSSMIQFDSGGFKFFTAPTGTIGNTISYTEAMTLNDNGSLLLKSGTGALGYGTGAGGTVTQLTSKSTAVTLNKPTGRIIMNNAALGAGATVSFILYNGLIGPSDTITLSIPNLIANDISNYKVTYNLYNGGALIFVTNVSSSILSEAISINFNLHKGAIS